MQAEADPCFPYSGGPGKTGGAYYVNTNLSTKPECRRFRHSIVQLLALSVLIKDILLYGILKLWKLRLHRC